MKVMWFIAKRNDHGQVESFQSGYSEELAHQLAQAYTGAHDNPEIRIITLDNRIRRIARWTPHWRIAK